MPMLFKSQAQAVVEASVIRAKWNADQARQEEAGNRLDLYMDDYDAIIRAKMSELFHKTNYDRLYYHVNQSQNILKRVVNEISMVYKAEPTRELSVESDRYATICDDLDIDTRMKRINRLTNLENETVVQVSILDGRLTYNTLTPNVCGVIQNLDDPTKADAIYYRVTLVNTAGSALYEYHWWDVDGNYLILDQSFAVKKTIYTPEDYPYKNAKGEFVIPFAVAHRQMPEDTFWDQDTGRDLYNAAVMLGIKMTLMDYYFKVASFKQIYIIGENVVVADKQVLDPLTVFKATGGPDGQAEIGVLDLQVRMDQLIQALTFQINTVINNYGISADAWSLSVNEMSGRALKIRNRALLEQREEQVPLYRKFESDLFEVTRIVNNAHAGALGWELIPEAAEFSIDFGEIDFPEDPLVERELDAKDLKMGLMSLGKFYQKYNPDIKDEKEAEKIIIENLKALAAITVTTPGLDEALDAILGRTSGGGGFGQPGQDQGGAEGAV